MFCREWVLLHVYVLSILFVRKGKGIITLPEPLFHYCGNAGMASSNKENIASLSLTCT